MWNFITIQLSCSLFLIIFVRLKVLLKEETPSCSEAVELWSRGLPFVIFFFFFFFLL